MKPDYAGLHYLVLGLGESGVAMLRWLDRCGAKLRVADTRGAPAGADTLREKYPQTELICGAFSSALLDGIDCVAVSPGISVNDPLLDHARARGIPVLGEIELFALALRAQTQQAKLIAITGTNGKTTTTALTKTLVQATGLCAVAAGNISPAALDALMQCLDAGLLPDVWVLELSSFQLETTASLHPDAASVLNVTDDHLDRHGSMAVYAAEKARIFDGQGLQVLNRGDDWSKAMQQAGRSAVSFGLDQPIEAHDFGVRLIGGVRWVVQGQTALMPCHEIPLAGDHNVANVLAALALGQGIGLPMAPMLDAVRAFRGLAHRVERVAKRSDGVLYFDDSKGTNVGATLAALRGLGCPVVLIAGGDGKGQDFSPLRDAFRDHARAVVLIGRDARRLAQETEGCGVPVVYAQDMDSAVSQANALAQPGDAVMLSPACASMDMYRNYAHRAEVFIAAVRQLPEVVA
jgi:UDP-N-acetylmuramoylalanine--D-glutamate ligase